MGYRHVSLARPNSTNQKKMEQNQEMQVKTRKPTTRLSKIAAGFFLITILFIVFVKVTNIAPPRHIFKYIFLFPYFALVLSLISVFKRETNRTLPIITIIVVVVFQAPIFINALSNRRGGTVIVTGKRSDFKIITGKSDYRPLHKAIIKGNLEGLEAALKSGIDPNARNRLSQSALEIATEKGNVEVVKLLIDAGADATAESDSIQNKPLILAATFGYVEIASVLIENGARLEQRDKLFGVTPVYAASTAANIEMVKWLHEKGAKLDVTNKRGWPITHKAGSADVLAYLVRNGIDINERDPLGNTILHNHVTASVIRKAIELGADLKAKNNEGKTPLEKAYFDSVKKALSDGLGKTKTRKMQ